MSALLNVVGTYVVRYPSANLDTTIEGFTPNQIKTELAGVHRELANATVNIDGNVITFSLPSGQKNTSV